MKLSQQVIQSKDQRGFGIVEGLVVVALVAIVGLAGWLVYSHSQNKSTLSKSSSESKDVTISVDQSKYQQFDQLNGVSFLMSKNWTADTVRPARTLVSLFNYNADTVKAELQADGRYPANTQEYNDVSVRKLKTYPYSLDNMYEIQLLVMTAPFDSIQGDPNVTDLQHYKVNGIQVADYIQKGTGGFLDQRVIEVKNQDASKEVRIVLNPNQSNNKVTKTNFDGLLELVGSIKFTE